ncbi:MAG TPA: cytochrome c3 family protein [Bdellovibrionota bacterium]|nr:cytochrome c3 family protein [Bdellovibrionota bacterium]
MKKNISIVLLLFIFIACNKPTKPIPDIIGEGALKIKNMSYPHSEEFRTTSLHGEAFLNNRESCIQCHGGDFMGGSSNTSCYSCHSYPHQPKWALPKNHGAAYLAQPSSLCLNCHTKKTSVSCDACHLLIPHSLEFKQGKAHAQSAQGYEGECTLCHTQLKKLLPTTGEEGCIKCHKIEGKGAAPIIKWRGP